MNHQAFNNTLFAVFGMGAALFGAIALNKVMNHHVIKTCNRDLYQVVYMKTAVGDSYGCISRMVLNGPPAPIKP
jgi:hypothetical protein